MNTPELIPKEADSSEKKPESPQQLEFFDRALCRISSKDKQRSLETIMRELIRMGIPGRSIKSMMEMITAFSEEIKSAAEEIDRL